MKLSKTLFAISTLAAFTTAIPFNATNSPLDNCQNYIGDCYSNGCEGYFAQPSNTIGTCTLGRWKGCPCEKCGGGHGYVGPCDENGCSGVQGVCTAGDYEGCTSSY